MRSILRDGDPHPNWPRRGALVVLVVGVAVASVTIPSSPDPPPERGEAVVWSSTQGEIRLDAPEAGGGRPHDPRAGGGESVLGADGRTDLVGRTTRYPNAAIGRLDFRRQGVTSWCTATLVSADTVLTAGHCLHDGRSAGDGWASWVRFTPGAEGNRAPFGSCGATELFVLPGWYVSGRPVHDLGLVRLDCRVGETVGWLGYRGVPGPAGLRGRSVHVRGYPGDQRWSTLWTMRDRVRVSRSLVVFYAADTFGGQSGSPVFRRQGCNGVRGPCVLAVHAYGLRNRHGPAGRFNHGPRLSDGRVDVIDAVVAG